jgi:hypothetical protein
VLVPKAHVPNRELPPPPEGKIWVTGMVNRTSGLMPPQKVAAEVCVYEHDDVPCVVTDTAAYFEIAVPRNEQVALLFRGSGLTPTLRPFITTDENMNIGNSRVANKAGFDPIAKAIGIENPPNTGGIFFAGVTGTTATLEPASGTRFFLKYGDKLDSEAKGVPMRGTGAFLGVKPGLTKIRFKHEDGPCRFRSDNLMSGWPDPKDPGVAVVPVLAGHHVHAITMYCGKDSHEKHPGLNRPRATNQAKKTPTKPASATAADKPASTKAE